MGVIKFRINSLGAIPGIVIYNLEYGEVLKDEFTTAYIKLLWYIFFIYIFSHIHYSNFKPSN